jgi:hypothetical protein
MSIKKRTLIIVSLSLMILTILGLIAGCDNLTTKNAIGDKHHHTKSYKTTIHEYIIGEYDRRYDTSKWEKIIKENYHPIASRNENEFQMLREFIIENIEL